MNLCNALFYYGATINLSCQKIFTLSWAYSNNYNHCSVGHIVKWILAKSFSRWSKFTGKPVKNKKNWPRLHCILQQHMVKTNVGYSPLLFGVTKQRGMVIEFKRFGGLFLIACHWWKSNAELWKVYFDCGKS